MSTKEFVELLTVVVWPATIWLAALVLWRPAVRLIDRLADTLTPKNVKVKLFGVEVDLTPTEVKIALEEVLRDIARSTSDMSDIERMLYEKIRLSAGAKTVEMLSPGFQRDTEPHRALQKLRRINLVLPLEGGHWTGDKHPIVTEFGKIVGTVLSNPR